MNDDTVKSAATVTILVMGRMTDEQRKDFLERVRAAYSDKGKPMPGVVIEPEAARALGFGMGMLITRHPPMSVGHHVELFPYQRVFLDEHARRQISEYKTGPRADMIVIDDMADAAAMSAWPELVKVPPRPAPPRMYGPMTFDDERRMLEGERRTIQREMSRSSFGRTRQDFMTRRRELLDRTHEIDALLRRPRPRST